MSAALDRVRRWRRFDHVRSPQAVPVFVARWRAEHLRNLTAEDLRALRGNVR